MINYLAQIFVFIAIFLLLATSLNLVLGIGGVFTIMQAVFFGIGAYAAADLIVGLHAPFPFELIGAVAVATVLGAAAAFFLLRLRAELVIIGTLALQLVCSTVFRNWNAATGGSYGIFGITRPSVFGLQMSSLPAFALFASIIAALFFGLAVALVRSPFGLAARAQRDDVVLAASLGHDAVRERTIMFIVGAAVAGAGGALYSEFIGYIDPSSFEVNQSLSIMTIVVVGGIGNLWGTLVGAVILMFLPQLLSLIPATSSVAGQFQLLLYGVILVAVVRFWPNGMVPERPSIRSRLRAGAAAASGGSVLGRLANVAVGQLAVAAPIVRVENVSKAFGGLRAVDDVSLTIEAGRITALIGPNGAGKTTLFNLMCGVLRADTGQVFVGSRDATRLQPFEIARLGVTRTFQDVRIFPRLTALENVVYALPSKDPERGDALLSEVGLSLHADRPAGSLSYAEQKILMMALVLAREDPVVFLDELAAGLDHSSVDALGVLVRKIAASGRAVCIVEHNLSFVWDVADFVYVLDEGHIVATGVPAAIQANAEVVRIYFGSGGVTGHA